MHTLSLLFILAITLVDVFSIAMPLALPNENLVSRKRANATNGSTLISTLTGSTDDLEVNIREWVALPSWGEKANDLGQS